MQEVPQYDYTCSPEDFVLRFESNARMEALFLLLPHIERAGWFRLLGRHWSGCDNVGRYTDLLQSLLYFADPAHLELMMTDEERSVRDSLPNVFTAWRGCYDFNYDGLSYSLDHDIAASFPYLRRYRARGRPLLLTAKVWRWAAVVKLDRQEWEIIALEPEIVCEKQLPRPLWEQRSLPPPSHTGC
jgi:hypothetical protein